MTTGTRRAGAGVAGLPRAVPGARSDRGKEEKVPGSDSRSGGDPGDVGGPECTGGPECAGGRGGSGSREGTGDPGDTRGIGAPGGDDVSAAGGDPEGGARQADAGSGGGPSARLLALFEHHRLTPTQRRVAHCLVRHAADAAYLSSVEVARLAGVSQPSVTRFAVALGFDGYPALRRHLRGLGPPARSETPAEVERNEYVGAVHAEIANLAELAGRLADPAPVSRAAALLAHSRPLVVLGLRTGAAPAGGFGYFAAKVLPEVRVLDEGGSRLVDRLEQARAAGATALLCFALPRYPRELGEALGAARALGYRVVTITDNPFAPVVALSDEVLVAGVGSRLVFDSCGAPQLLGQILLQAMCDVDPGRAQARLEEFERRAGEWNLFEG